MRHRLQADRVGLRPCSHRLLTSDGTLDFDFAVDKGTPAQHALSAIYAAGTVPRTARPAVMDVGPEGTPVERHDRTVADRPPQRPDLVVRAVVRGDRRPGGMGARCPRPRDGKADAIDAKQVQRAFRSQLRDAHPDHGANDDGAAQRIAELTEARRILLG